MKLAAYVGGAIAGVVLACVPAVAGTLSIPGLGNGGNGGIEVVSWSWGTSGAREASSGMATGKRQYQPLLIRKRIDRNSPLLLKACQSGQVFPLVTASMNGEVSKFTNVTLTNCSSSGDSEQFTLTFQKITMDK